MLAWLISLVWLGPALGWSASCSRSRTRAAACLLSSSPGTSCCCCCCCCCGGGGGMSPGPCCCCRLWLASIWRRCSATAARPSSSRSRHSKSAEWYSPAGTVPSPTNPRHTKLLLLLIILPLLLLQLIVLWGPLDSAPAEEPACILPLARRLAGGGRAPHALLLHAPAPGHRPRPRVAAAAIMPKRTPGGSARLRERCAGPRCATLCSDRLWSWAALRCALICWAPKQAHPD